MPSIATVASELEGGFEQPVSLAGKVQVLAYPTMPLAGFTIAGSGTYLSPLLFADGYQTLTVGLTMNQAGTLLITRYIDMAGTMARASPSSTAIVSGTLLIVDAFTDDLPWVTFTISITNSGGLATLANFAIIMNAD